MVLKLTAQRFQPIITTFSELYWAPRKYTLLLPTWVGIRREREKETKQTNKEIGRLDDTIQIITTIKRLNEVSYPIRKRLIDSFDIGYKIFYTTLMKLKIKIMHANKYIIYK